MELHLSVVVVVVHAEDLVVGQDVQQLPLSLVHEDALVLAQLLRAPHQGDVDVINCRSNTTMERREITMATSSSRFSAQQDGDGADVLLGF